MELLIVIVVMTIISAISLGRYTKYQGTRLLDATTEEIANYLRYAQQKSVSQEQGLQWGVHFENSPSGRDFYSLYTGATYSAPTETRFLPANVEFSLPTSGNSTNISFSKLVGLNAEGVEKEIVVQLLNNGAARVIRSTPAAVITVSEGEKGSWNFNEGTGTTVADTTIYANNGLLVNGPTWQTGSNCISGSCLSFDGVNDYVVTNASILSTNSFTIAMWFKSLGNTTGKHIFEGNVLSSPSLEGMDTNYNFYIGNTAPASIGPVSVGQWYYFTGTFDKSTGVRKAYLNGILMNTNTSTISDGITSFYLASRAGTSRYFNGFIDEVRIYNRVLSATEIKQHYNAR